VKNAIISAIMILVTVGLANAAPATATTVLAKSHRTDRSLTGPKPPAQSRIFLIPTTCGQEMREITRLAAEGVRSIACISDRASPRPEWARTYMSTSRNENDASPAKGPSCITGRWNLYRLDACGETSDYINVIDAKTGKLIGQITFTIIDRFVLSYKSRTFAENISIDFTKGWGDIAGMTVTLDVTCGSHCSAKSHLPPDEPASVGRDLVGVVSYDDTTKTRDTTHSRYSLTPGSAALKPATWSSLNYRCDDELPGNISAGCVFPEYNPQLTTMVSLPEINANIYNIQTAGPHHYGRYMPSNGHPLHRDDSLSAANRAAACPAPGKKPSGKTCDEYPFASTEEGASRTKRPDWGSAWVAESEQNAQGGRLNTFYLQNRILTGDAYWVYST
jgi:Deoxyribonuclease NucA/NucB